MTESKPAAPVPSERLSLSATQVLASGLAAVSATVAASYFGVAGTVIGAALGSVISVVGGAIYTYSIRQTRNRVRQTLDVAVSQRFSVRSPSVADRQPFSVRLRSALPALNPRRLGLAAAGLFLLVLAATTGFELASGQPLAATVSGKHGSGTSLDGGKTSKPSVPASHSPSSSASSQPTVTVTVPASSVPASSAPASGSPSSNPATGNPPSSGAPSSAAPSSQPPSSPPATSSSPVG